MAPETPLPPSAPAQAPAPGSLYTLTEARVLLRVDKAFLRRFAAALGLKAPSAGASLVFTAAQVAAMDRLLHRPRVNGVRPVKVYNRWVFLPNRPRVLERAEPAPALYTVAGACEALNVSQVLLRRLRALAGVEPEAVLGNRRFFTAAQIESLRASYDRYLPNRDKTVRHRKGTPRREEYGIS